MTRVKPIVFFVLLSAMSLVGVWAILVATRDGAGVSPDSTKYIGAARNVLAGRGYMVADWNDGGYVPLAHYPPLYPTLLALGGLTGATPWHVSRWLAAFLFGLTILFTGSLVYENGRRAMWSGLLAAGLVLASWDVHYVHTGAWSEPPMLLFVVVSLGVLGLYLQGGPRRFFYFSCAAAALAMLSRYAAAPLAPAGALGVALFGPGGRRRRLRDAALYLALAGAPLAMWMARNAVLTGSPTNRPTAWHPVTARHFKVCRRTLAMWLAPDGERWSASATNRTLWIALAVLLVVVAGMALRTWRRRDAAPDSPAAPTPRPYLAWLCLIFGALYFAFLLVSISLVDVITPLNRRILVHLHLVAIVLFVSAIGGFSRWRGWRRLVGVALFAAGCAFAVWQGREAADFVRNDRKHVRGYASRRWRRAKILRRIRDMPPDKRIYTNCAWGVYFHTNRPEPGLPYRLNQFAQLPDPRYEERFARMKRELESGEAIFIHLKLHGWGRYPTPRKEFFKRIELKRIERTSEADIYVGRP